MTRRVAFTIPGEPGYKGRPRANTLWRRGADGKPELVTRPGKDGRRIPVLAVSTPKDTEDWEGTVRSYAVSAMRAVEGVLLDGPLSVTIRTYYSRPKYLSKGKRPKPPVPKHTKPDYDNVAKAITDALNGIVYPDNGRIAFARIECWYAAGEGYGNQQARTEVVIEEVGEETKDGEQRGHAMVAANPVQGGLL